MRPLASALAATSTVAVLALGALVPPASAASAPAGEARVAAIMTAATAQAQRSSATRLVIPSLGVNAGIIDTGVTSGGALAVGGSVTDVYRWRDGVFPGQRGSAVLAGHTWSKGDGVFDRLGTLKPGARVDVGRYVFEVTRKQKVSSMRPAAVARLYSDRGRPRLVLITCGDRNAATGVYASRILVKAKLVGVTR